MKLFCVIAVLLLVFVQVTRCRGDEDAEDPPRAKPEDVGMSAEKLARIKPMLERLLERKKIGGAVVMVVRRGKVVFAEAAGRQNEGGAAMKIDSVFRIYSMTKPITSTAIMMLVEEGKIDLEDPVASHIPSFKALKVYSGMKDGQQELQAPKREMTIRDLLRHTSGLTYGFFGNTYVDQQYRQAGVLARTDTLAETVAKLKDLPLMYHPGEKWAYSVATDVLGHLVERISGKRLDEFFRRRIFEPLKMNDTGFFVPSEAQTRFADNWGPRRDGDGLQVIDDAKTSRYLQPPRLLSGGGGLVSTAPDYLRFCQMMLNQGELDGVRILKTETVEQMTRNQIPDKTFPIALSGGPRQGVGFGLGFSVVAEKIKLAPYVPVGEYGWGGAASTHFWISPKHELAVAALTQHMPFTMQLEVAVKPLVYAAILP